MVLTFILSCKVERSVSSAGTEPFLFTLLKRLELDIAMATSSLHCLQLDPALRSRVADTLVPITKMKDTLYIILVAEGRVVTLVRPKKHSIHPTGLFPWM